MMSTATMSHLAWGGVRLNERPSYLRYRLRAKPAMCQREIVPTVRALGQALNRLGVRRLLASASERGLDTNPAAAGAVHATGRILFSGIHAGNQRFHYHRERGHDGRCGRHNAGAHHPARLHRVDGAAQDWVGTSTRHITIGGGR